MKRYAIAAAVAAGLLGLTSDAHAQYGYSYGVYNGYNPANGRYYTDTLRATPYGTQLNTSYYSPYLGTTGQRTAYQDFYGNRATQGSGYNTLYGRGYNYGSGYNSFYGQGYRYGFRY